MDAMVLLALLFFSIVQLSCVSPDNPSLGNFFVPLHYDARHYAQDCSIFYHQVGKSSYSCGDCWAHAGAQQLGVVLCSVRMRPDAPLSAYDAVTCSRADDPCNGQLYNGLEAIAALGLTTGSNVPGKYGNCKRYRFHLCDKSTQKTFDDPECPHFANGSYKKYEFDPLEYCINNCDDLSELKRFGTSSAVVTINKLSPDYMQNIKEAIMSNGSVIAAYWMGAAFKELKNFDIFDKTEKDYEGRSNHYLLLKGWGVEETRSGHKRPYWILKNPNRGKDFGVNGYVRVVRGRNLNSIESEVLFFKNANWPPSCRPRPYMEVIYIEDGKIKCKSNEGRRCPDGCVATKTVPKILDFSCDGGRLGIARSVDLEMTCDTRHDL